MTFIETGDRAASGDWSSRYEIYGSGSLRGGSSGVIVEVMVNGRTEHARLWVEKADKTLGFSPD